MDDPLYGWLVRLGTATAVDSKALTRELRRHGLRCSRSGSEVFVSAGDEDGARALAARLERLELVQSARPQRVLPIS